ncbi:aldehyde dehydrogenase family protein, partial [Paraburkholderia sp. SIMBA_030]|uniref:aldehyde dehydrogenase family protein n=1 Tax=Paraburkholderia sp. SIMBA_030 TaxID=3085773 RepID=UPI00397AF495
WVEPTEGGKLMEIVSPSLETTIGKLTLGSAHDADHAVAAARAAFPAWSESSREAHIELLERIAACYRERLGELAHAVCEEIGAPISLCKT